MSLHIYGPTADNSIRVRARCPIDKKMRYGRFTLYYDTWHLSLECGVFVGAEGPWRGHPGPRGGRRPRYSQPRTFKEWPMRQWLQRVPKPF